MHAGDRAAARARSASFSADGAATERDGLGRRAGRSPAARRRMTASRAPTKLLRDSALSTGNPSASRASVWRIRSRFCATDLPKPRPGSITIDSRAMPRPVA